jgi:hypothetical protein
MDPGFRMRDARSVIWDSEKILSYIRDWNPGIKKASNPYPASRSVTLEYLMIINKVPGIVSGHNTAKSIKMRTEKGDVKMLPNLILGTVPYPY